MFLLIHIDIVVQISNNHIFGTIVSIGTFKSEPVNHGKAARFLFYTYREYASQVYISDYPTFRSSHHQCYFLASDHVLPQFTPKSGGMSDSRTSRRALCQRESSLPMLISHWIERRQTVVSAARVYYKHDSASEIAVSTGFHMFVH